MQKILIRLLTVGVMLCFVNTSAQSTESFTNYVTTCKQQLGFTDADMAAVASNLNCSKAFIFAPHDPNQFNPLNDFMGYARITDSVDLVFACRWLDGRTADRVNNSPFVPPFVQAASIELMIHNRQSGNTCYFQAKERPISGPDNRLESGVPIAIVSPTVAAAAAPNTPEANFWVSPTELDSSLPCVDCHVAGPYISTPRIAPVLAQFGLLNNRHDTLGLTLNAQNQPVGNYHAVGATFSHFNTMLVTNNGSNSCTLGCHNIAYGSTALDVLHNVIDSDEQRTLLPAIKDVIDISGTGATDVSVITSGAMAPFDDGSSYRWINLDTPVDGVETENFADALNASGTPAPKLLQYCTAPGELEAHVVGVPGNFAFNTVAMSQIPDRLRTFNLKEGLVCLSSDQENGRSCNNYSIRYLCSVNTVNGTPTWSDWYNTDSPTGDGDHEERSRDQNICGGATPIAIQAQVNSNPSYIMGPNDRLARFSRYGLTCNNTDQVDGKCSNYVVRYSSCGIAPPIFTGALTNVNVPSSGAKQLTAATGLSAKAQGHNNGWDTQTWTLDPVANTEYVRLRNTSNNITVYLNVTSTTEQATVGTAAFNSTATGEMWTVETVVGNSGVRLKNLLSGKYLTMGDPNSYPNSPDYLPIFSQGLNTSWNTQRWLIQ